MKLDWEAVVTVAGQTQRNADLIDGEALNQDIERIRAKDPNFARMIDQFCVQAARSSWSPNEAIGHAALFIYKVFEEQDKIDKLKN